MTKRKRATAKPKTNGVISDTILTADCKPHKSNYNKHSDAQIEDLRESLRQFGPVRSIVVQKKKRGKGYTIVAGEGIWTAAWAEEIPELPARIIPAKWSATKVKAYLAADNELGRYATADEMQLAALVQHVHDTEGETLARLAAGEKNALERLLAMTNGHDVPEDAGARVSEAERLQEVWGVKTGDLWQLGAHRLVCGDCTDPAVVERVMDGERAQMVFTDPPYGVDYEGGTIKRKALSGDKAPSLYGPALKLVYAHTLDNVAIYLWHSDSKSAAVSAAVSAAGFERRCTIMWNKNQAQFGALGAQYKTKHEPCYYLYKKGKNPAWYGPTNEVTVWDIDRASANVFHPTEKPTALAERAIRNSSVSDDIVIDWFLGGGATLIAAERLSRRARCIEIASEYVAVSLQRFLDTTSIQPQRIDARSGVRRGA